MKNIKFYALSFLASTFVGLFFARCDINNDYSPPDSVPSETSAIKIRLSDAPGDYKEVNIDVRDIMIKGNTDSGDEGWISIGNTPAGGMVYNLLDLTGGVTVMLADTIIPSIYLGQVRLILGDNNTIVLNDDESTTIPLNTPSAQQSGLKVKVDQTLLGGISYDFLLDFDVDQSVVKAGNSGNYNLHPVLRVTTVANSGAIRGTITNIMDAKKVLATVEVGTETVSTYTNDAGVFQLNGVPPGTYTVTLSPDPTSGLLIKMITGVVVVNGEVTDTGSISM
ncbi:protein of unknown function [Flavobacterium fluvii]|uniref:DUF4382 domain-containing protein n=1 Tax=Flavobacterium fluvii TaxID=468056 RepID=A0A1M5ENH6_9FLAO|nr:DUF4382 domain-containing protein [Flavobacterium fluvii]SHF80736.1 protein of unknown function [Flavobacterium fluvii]